MRVFGWWARSDGEVVEVTGAHNFTAHGQVVYNLGFGDLELHEVVDSGKKFVGFNVVFESDGMGVFTVFDYIEVIKDFHRWHHPSQHIIRPLLNH